MGISGILTPEQAVAGFSRSAVLTIVGLFVITATLEQTGVVQWLAEQLAQLSGTREPRMIAVFMGAGALLSLVMNNIAAGAVLLPAAVSVARQARCASRAADAAGVRHAARRHGHALHHRQHYHQRQPPGARASAA